MRAAAIWQRYNTVLVTEVGSTVHGVTNAAVDDVDAMGLFIESAPSVLGLTRQKTVSWRTQPEGVPSGPEDEDLVLYTLRKWSRLAAAGNPTVLLPLFVGPEKVYATSALGDRLRAERRRFVTRRTGMAYLGYAKSQRESLLGLRGGRVDRERYRCAYGYDTKYAYHMLRLGMQGREVVETGDLTLPMPAKDREYLLTVRAGDWPLEDVLAVAERNEGRLLQAIEGVALAERVDAEWLDELLVDAYLEAFAAQRTT